MCEETSACGHYLVRVVYGGTYVWLDGVLSGVLAECLVVSSVGAVVSGLVFSCRCPMCGFTSA